MSNVALNLKLRSIQGKGASRRLRKTGMVPGVLYGGDGPATVIELDHKTLLLQLNTRDFQSSIITIDIDGDKQDVLLRDYQMHPWKKQILHVDFQRVMSDQVINMNVPLHFVNEDVCPGVKLGGGIVNHAITEIAIQCLPRQLPKFLEADLINLDVGGSMHLSELKLPEGVEAVLAVKGEDPVLATVQVPRAVVEEETVAADESDPSATTSTEDGPEAEVDKE